MKTTSGVVYAVCAVLWGGTGLAAADEPAVEPVVEPAPGDSLFDYLASEVLTPPTVELASKREQSLLDAPADLTVLDAEAIREANVDNIAQLMRRVPGAHVVQANANVYFVGLRGLNRLANNHVLVLLDGRAIADTVQGAAPWGALAAHPGDLERIEVLHGPGSTLYGANALSGVVNIRTKRPLDHPGHEAWAASGTYLVPDLDPTGAARTRMSNGGDAFAAVSWANASKTLGARLSGGFNAIPEWRDLDETAAPEYGNFHYYARATSQYRRGDTEIVASAAHVFAQSDTTFTLTVQNLPFAISEQSVNVLLEQRDVLGIGDFKLHVDGRRFDNTSRYYDAAAGQLVAESNSDFAGHASAQLDISSWGGRNIVTMGVDAGASKTRKVFRISPSSRYLAAVVQDELVLSSSPRVLLSGGLRAERIEAGDGEGTEVVYANLNPRAALVVNLGDRHAVRITGATAYRTPVPMENFVDIAFEDDDPDAPDPTVFAANPQLRPTRVRSAEVGYRGYPQPALRVSVTAFAQQLLGVSGASAELRLPLRFENLYDVDELGATAEAEYRLGSASRAHAHYAYTHRERADTGEPFGEWPTHIAGFGGRVALTDRVRLGGDLSVWSSISPDVVVRRDVEIQRADERVASQAIASLRLSRVLFEGAGEIYLGVRNIGGFFREREHLRQYASDYVQPVGGAVVVGVMIREGGP